MSASADLDAVSLAVSACAATSIRRGFTALMLGEPMGLLIAYGTDVFGLLRAQHQQISGRTVMVLDERGVARGAEFQALRKMIAVHEAAEEIVLRRETRRLPDGDRIADARLREEHQAKELLVELDSLDLDSAAFTSLLQKLQTNLVAHAAAEEAEEFTPLSAELNDFQIARMNRAVEMWESLSPTRPHPAVESGVALRLAGPFLGMLDRVRDFIERGDQPEDI